MGRDGLRLVAGGAEPAKLEAIADPAIFQNRCIEAYQVSQVARGFSPVTMDNGAGVLERFLAACGRPAWEVTPDDVDRVIAGLSAQGLVASTRRGYVQAFKGFHAFLVARKTAEIEAAFGIRLVDPVDRVQRSTSCGRGLSFNECPTQPRTDGGVLRVLEGARSGRLASTRPQHGTTHCFGRCTWPGCERRSRRR